MTWHQMDAWSHTGENLLTSFELPTNIGDYHGSIVDGWFIAPDTASYRF